MKNNAKTIVRKYCFKCLLVLFCAISLFVLSNIFVPFPFPLLIHVPIAASAALLLRKIFSQDILSVLYKELNPEKFDAILLESRKFAPKAQYQVDSALCRGDYQTVTNICVAKLKEIRAKRKSIYYLVALARVYFETGNLDKLKVICGKYDENLKNSRRGNKQQQYDVIMQFYKCFLNGDYENCKIICGERNKIEKQILGYDLERVNVSFDYAVLLYKTRDLDSATECFNQIVNNAPKMHCARIAEKYLNAIKADKNVDLYVEIISDENYIVPFSRKRKMLKIAAGILISMWCLLFLVVASNYINYRIEKHKFYSELNASLTRQYGEYEIVSCFNLEKDGNVIDCLCIVEKANGMIDVGYITNRIVDKTIRFKKLVDVRIGLHALASGSDQYIGFKFVEDKNDIPKHTYRIEEIETNGKTIYFYVDYIGPFEDYYKK